jgi:hypothetical protein
MASLWDQLRDRLGPGELEEAKRILGRDRVRRNKDAWEELKALQEMHEQFCGQNATLAEEAEAAAANRARLLHAPHRTLVLQELQMLLRHLDGANVDSLLDDRDMEAFRFARGLLEVTRPSTATSTAASTAPSLSSCASDISVNSLRDIEESLDGVRAAFDQEYSELLSRIEEANESLETEAQLQGEFNSRKKVLEPSTADLQRLAKKLQQVSTLPRADEKLPSMSRVHRLRSLVQNFRPKTPLLELIDEEAPSVSTKTGKPSLEDLLFEPAPRATPRAG